MAKIDPPAIATVLGIVATVVALGWWRAIGWTTPAEHEADIQHIEDHAQETQKAIVEFQTRWLCDEDREELDELLDKPTRTDKEVQRVRELADNIDERDCRQF